MASIQEKFLESDSLEFQVCPDAPTIKPKRRCSFFEEDDSFSLGNVDSIGQSLGSSDSADSAESGLSDIFKEKDSIFSFLNHMKLRKSSF